MWYVKCIEKLKTRKLTTLVSIKSKAEQPRSRHARFLPKKKKKE